MSGCAGFNGESKMDAQITHLSGFDPTVFPHSSHISSLRKPWREMKSSALPPPLPPLATSLLVCSGLGIEGGTSPPPVSNDFRKSLHHSQRSLLPQDSLHNSQMTGFAKLSLENFCRECTSTALLSPMESRKSEVEGNFSMQVPQNPFSALHPERPSGHLCCFEQFDLFIVVYTD
jgi:hypothetical protein